MPKNTNRTRIDEEWQPDTAGREFAEQRGVPESEVGAFVDHHLSRGNLMASWPAAWRTWCRNAVRFGTATGKPLKSAVVLAFDSSDAYGANAWGYKLSGTKTETFHGQPVLALCGYPIIELAREICEAAGWDQDQRLDLEPIAQAIRSGYDPDMMVDVAKNARRPDRPTLNYYAAIWRDRHAKASAA